MVSKKSFFYIMIPSMIAAVAVNLALRHPDFNPGPALAAQTSADGKFLVTTNKNHSVILWDLEQAKMKLISKKASHYTAHFIKNTHDIKWQDNTRHQYHITHNA